MIIEKAVIAAAGIGSRLLPTTKEMPKEMLPMFSIDSNGELSLKPVLQMIFEQLYDVGFREFCFIVGRGKRSVEDHFTPDYIFVESLRKTGKESKAKSLEEFYRRIENSIIIWVNQPEPKGFGHAVLMAEPFINDKPFLVHAGDTYILSENHSYLRRLLNHYIAHRPEAVLVLRKVHTSRKLYGVAEVDALHGIINVKRVIEKPEKPPTNLAIMPIYIFDPLIIDALKNTPPGVNNEIQLTDAIQRLIDQHFTAQAIILDEDEERLDVGTPEIYWESINAAYKNLKRPK